MKTSDQIAVAIVTWNSTKTIARSLACLAQQTLKPSLVVIVDNGSSDLQDLQCLVDKYPFCQLIALSENTGFAKANNLAIAKCKDYELLALLNPDAYPEDQWLEHLYLASQKYPAFGCFASKLLQLDTRYLDGAGDLLWFYGKPKRRGYGQPSALRYQQDEPVFSPCAAAALYRVEALRSVDGFDEMYFCYVEDVDLGFRLQLRGFACMFVHDAIAIHEGSASLGKRSDFSLYYGQRNIVLNFCKNMPTALFLIFFIPHLLLNFYYLLGAFLLGRGGVVGKAKIDAVKMLPAVLKSRREVQSKRNISLWKIFKMLTFL